MLALSWIYAPVMGASRKVEDLAFWEFIFGPVMSASSVPGSRTQTEGTDGLIKSAERPEISRKA